MNKWTGIGRLTKEPDVRYSNKNGEQMCIARYTLAVPRKASKEADYISCVAFGKQGEFVEKYLKKGMKIAVAGRIQTGSYEKDGKKIYTTDIVVEEHEFVESKGASDGSAVGYQSQTAPAPQDASAEGFINIPEDIENSLPWK